MRRPLLIALMLAAVLALAAYALWTRRPAAPAGSQTGALAGRDAAARGASTGTAPGASSGRPGGGPSADRPVPVRTAMARLGDVDVTLDALGTVTALNTVAVRARVDGQLVRIAFVEGQQVKAGDVVAEIDPRPFQVQVDAARGQLARDRALLANARVDLERYQGLLAKDGIPRQQVDTQAALVRQYEGTVQSDEAQLANAQLQLEFTRVRAPVAGRLGLRQVDVGNMVKAADTAGIVTLTQTRPITVIFPIPSGALGPVLEQLRAQRTLAVEAYDREGARRLARGRLLTVDNQIDITTGTVRLKAQFDNTDDALFPNLFVNVRLLVDTRRGVTLVPQAAIQRGAPGAFVYVVKPDSAVALQVVQLGPASGNEVAVSGVAPGAQVVVDGADRLRDGARVQVVGDDPAGGPGSATGPGRPAEVAGAGAVGGTGAARGAGAASGAAAASGASSAGGAPRAAGLSAASAGRSTPVAAQ